MDKLTQARQIISSVDKEIAALFEKRMDAVRLVSEYKIENGLPIYDGDREAALIERNSALIEKEDLRPYYVDFLRNTMRVSRHFQAKLAEGMRVAFSGVEGAFAAIAAGKIFTQCVRVPYPDFKSAYQAVIDGDCDCAVLPIENSTAGEVGQVMDMMFSGPLFVSGIYDLSVIHNLMAVPGTDIKQIKEVISHPQALAQCAPYIREHGFSQKEFENTARAAKFVAEQKSPHLAAIASDETAKLYGLEILEKGINERNVNTTRFAVLTRSMARNDSPSGKHSILMFTVRNEAGSLAKAVSIIGQYGYNMRCLRSRPMKELLWQYYFYVEAEGDLGSENGLKMLKELETCCDKLRMLGSFRYPAQLN